MTDEKRPKVERVRPASGVDFYTLNRTDGPTEAAAPTGVEEDLRQLARIGAYLASKFPHLKGRDVDEACLEVLSSVSYQAHTFPDYTINFQQRGPDLPEVIERAVEFLEEVRKCLISDTSRGLGRSGLVAHSIALKAELNDLVEAVVSDSKQVDRAWLRDVAVVASLLAARLEPKVEDSTESYSPPLVQSPTVPADYPDRVAFPTPGGPVDRFLDAKFPGSTGLTGEQREAVARVKEQVMALARDPAHLQLAWTGAREEQLARDLEGILKAQSELRPKATGAPAILDLQKQIVEALKAFVTVANNDKPR